MKITWDSAVRLYNIYKCVESTPNAVILPQHKEWKMARSQSRQVNVEMNFEFELRQGIEHWALQMLTVYIYYV